MINGAWLEVDGKETPVTCGVSIPAVKLKRVHTFLLNLTFDNQSHYAP